MQKQLWNILEPTFCEQRPWIWYKLDKQYISNCGKHTGLVLCEPSAVWIGKEASLPHPCRTLKLRPYLFFFNKSQRFFFNKMLKKFGFITVSGLNLNPNMAIYGHIWPYLVWFFWAFSKMIKTIQRWAILEHHGYLYWETCCFMMLPGTKELKVFWQEWPPVTGDVQCTRPPHI